MKQDLNNKIREVDRILPFPIYIQMAMAELGTPSTGDFEICCPLHEENTPSFKYSDKLGIWSCFGSCKAHGGTVEFHKRMMEKKMGGSVAYRTAILHLIKVFNLPITYNTEHQIPKQLDYSIQELKEEFKEILQLSKDVVVVHDTHINQTILRMFTVNNRKNMEENKQDRYESDGGR